MLGHISHIVKKNHVFTSLLLDPGAWIKQNKYIVMITKKESTKFVVDFMTPWAGILVQGRGHISHVVETLNFFKFLLSTVEHRSNKLSLY